MGLVEAQARIDERLHQGAPLERVEREVIAPAPHTQEQKAALRMFASAIARSVSRQRAGAGRRVARSSALG
jgi:hypothetical protein